MEEFIDGLDEYSTADDLDCVSKFIVVRALKKSQLKVCEHLTSSRQITGVNLLLTLRRSNPVEIPDRHIHR